MNLISTICYVGLQLTCNGTELKTDEVSTWVPLSEVKAPIATSDVKSLAAHMMARQYSTKGNIPADTTAKLICTRINITMRCGGLIAETQRLWDEKPWPLDAFEYDLVNKIWGGFFDTARSTLPVTP